MICLSCHFLPLSSASTDRRCPLVCVPSSLLVLLRLVKRTCSALKRSTYCLYLVPCTAHLQRLLTRAEQGLCMQYCLEASAPPTEQHACLQTVEMLLASKHLSTPSRLLPCVPSSAAFSAGTTVIQHVHCWTCPRSGWGSWWSKWSQSPTATKEHHFWPTQSPVWRDSLPPSSPARSTRYPDIVPWKPIY